MRLLPKYGLIHPYLQSYEKILSFTFCRCGNWSSNILNQSSPLLEDPIGGGSFALWPVTPVSLDYRLTSPHSLIPRNFLLIVGWDINSVFLWHSFFFCGFRLVQPVLFSQSVKCWLFSSPGHTSFPLSHTPSSVSSSPTSRLPDWQGSRDTSWLQYADWNYHCDHRSDLISCLFLESQRLTSGANVFWIPREVHFFPLWTLYINYLYSTWAN